MSQYKKLYILPIISAALLLSGCNGAVIMSQTANVIETAVNGGEVNIEAKSYAAADYLHQHIRTFIDSDDVIKAVPLYNAMQDEEHMADLSTLIPYQVGTRLGLLGYRVNMTQVSDNPTSGVLNNKAAGRFVLSGAFEQEPAGFRMHLYRSTAVSLSVTDTKSGRIIASFDYTLPRNRIVNNMSDVPLPAEEEAAEEMPVKASTQQDTLEN